ncbi:hypothetical protein IQ277_19445 [Nostocales cyanobacterium LEGE 12452]|nr:hypothetical protein [Nostocales cyanobacterium LEGE 12452]
MLPEQWRSFLRQPYSLIHHSRSLESAIAPLAILRMYCTLAYEKLYGDWLWHYFKGNRSLYSQPISIPISIKPVRIWRINFKSAVRNIRKI